MSRFRPLLALLLLLLWAPGLGTQQPPPLRVHFVDVGQGDGVLIQSPTGQNVIYDAGENPTRMRDYVSSLGVAAIGLVVSSHNHADHIGGLPEVLRLFRPQFYMENGVPATTQVYARVLDAVAASGMGADKFVFGAESGAFVASFDKSWRELFQLAGLPVGRREGLTWHDLRHEFVSFLADSGGKIHEVKEAARHKDIRTTERYMTAREERVKTLMSKLVDRSA